MQIRLTIYTELIKNFEKESIIYLLTIDWGKNENMKFNRLKIE